MPLVVPTLFSEALVLASCDVGHLESAAQGAKSLASHVALGHVTSF